MILRPRVTRRALYLPSTAMADLAFLLLVFVAIGGIFSAARGIPLQVPEESLASDLPAPDTPAVWVKVRADASLLVDGTAMPLELGIPALRARLSPYPEAVIVVGAEPQVSYGSLATILGRLLSERSGPGGAERRIAIPTRRQIESYVRATGSDPFEVVR